VYARPLTIPASGSLHAPRCGVPLSRPAACGPSGRAFPGAFRPFADVLSAPPGLRLFLSASDASVKPTPVISGFLSDIALSGGLKTKANFESYQRQCINIKKKSQQRMV